MRNLKYMSGKNKLVSSRVLWVHVEIEIHWLVIIVCALQWMVLREEPEMSLEKMVTFWINVILGKKYPATWHEYSRWLRMRWTSILKLIRLLRDSGINAMVLNDTLQKGLLILSMWFKHKHSCRKHNYL